MCCKHGDWAGQNLKEHMSLLPIKLGVGRYPGADQTSGSAVKYRGTTRDGLEGQPLQKSKDHHLTHNNPESSTHRIIVNGVSIGIVASLL